MSDPELAARAQRAAVRLEQSWERWRRLRGLNTERAQPISSYVGYSLVEPWGRPRVVFGVGAEEAEQLSALLESDERDSRYDQSLLWEAEIPAQVQPTGAEPIERAAAQAERGPERAEANSSHGAQGEWGRASFPESRAGYQEPMTTFAAAPVYEPEPPRREPGPGRHEPDLTRREPVPDLVADLAGWSSGELPGQASAGLAAWPGAKAEAERQERQAAERQAAERQAVGSVGPKAHGPADHVETQVAPEHRPGSNSPEPTGWLRLA